MAATVTCSILFEARAAEMEDALEPHAQLNKTQRCLIGAYFLNDIRSKLQLSSIQASSGIQIKPARLQMVAGLLSLFAQLARGISHRSHFGPAVSVPTAAYP